MCSSEQLEQDPSISVRISLKEWNDVIRRLDALEKGIVYTPTSVTPRCPKCAYYHYPEGFCPADLGRPTVLVS